MFIYISEREIVNETKHLPSFSTSFIKFFAEEIYSVKIIIIQKKERFISIFVVVQSAN